MKGILNGYKSKPTINTSVAKKENPSINQRKGQIGLVFDGEIRKRVNFLRLFIHQIGSSANHLSAQNQSIIMNNSHMPHVVVTPHYYLSFDRLFLFLLLHCIHPHTYRYRNHLSHNNTYHINRKDACTNNHDILLP